MRPLRISLFFILVISFFSCGNAVHADSITLSDGKEVKGIVVEEYGDRVIMSTYEGEKTIFKKNIRGINFDLPEQNLSKLGDNAMAKREYKKAYFYYSKANKANPDYAYASDKMNYIVGYLFRKEGEGKLKDVQRMQEVEDWPKRSEETSSEKELEERFGMRVKEKKGAIFIAKVIKNSPAYSADLREGDKLISVWGRLTGYMSPDEICRLLLEESPGEIKFNFERVIILHKAKLPQDYSSVIDGSFDMLFDGLTVTELSEKGSGYKAGLRKNDLIVSIDGVSTRYMPIGEAVKKIEDTDYDRVRFVVMRSATMWRE